MPSASSKSSQGQIQVNSADLLQDPLKNALQVFEKKQRNLEKRKLKLVETKKKAELGGELNEDQKLALSNLALVENSVETVRELHKHMLALEQEYNRLVKKEQKRSKQEQRDQAESRIRSVGLKIVEVQGILGVLTEEVRPDFLAGTNGACLLTEDEISYLDSIYELINPSESEESEKKLSVRTKLAGEHLLNLVEGKEKEAFEGITYKQILDILDKVQGSGYFDKESGTEVDVEPSEPVEPVELEETPEVDVDVETPVETPVTPEEYPATTFEEETELETPVTEEPSAPVNGVDLPPEVQPSPEDEKLDFLGESEITTQATAEQPLNPVSPEFIPRNMQGQTDDGWNESDTTSGNSGWNETGNSNETSGWQSVPDSTNPSANHQQGNNRDGYRGRGGRGGRGFGGRGRGRGNYRGGRQDGGNYRGDGSYRGDGNYRGDYRGNRGGRGGNRGNRGGPRGGNRGGNSNRGGPRDGGRPPSQQ